MANLIAGLSSQGHEIAVISVADGGPVGDRLQEMGVPVYELRFSTAASSVAKLMRLFHLVGDIDPDIVQTWLYRADLLGAVIRLQDRKRPVVWGVHSTNPLRQHLRRSLIVCLNMLLSRVVPRAIIYCSEHACSEHVRIGYAAGRGHVIPNGIDTSVFRPDAEARFSIRKELGLDEQAILIGLVARLSPLKGHDNFFAAARDLHTRFPDAHFVLCGEGIEPGNAALATMIEQADIARVTHLLGPRLDMHRVTAAFDIANSTSISESFSLTIAEAMACGVPCVSTDCGGPRDLMKDLGYLVPVNDPSALCRAWIEVLRLSRESRSALGHALREHIKRNYSINRTTEAYMQLYTELWASYRGGNRM